MELTSTGKHVNFSAERVAARWYSGLLKKEDLPELARDALEAGFDGRSLRRIAGLELNDLTDIDKFIDAALGEMGVPKLTKRAALLKVAKETFEQTVAGARNPYEGAREVVGMLYRGIDDQYPQIMYDLEDVAEMIESCPEDRRKWEKGNCVSYERLSPAERDQRCVISIDAPFASGCSRL